MYCPFHFQEDSAAQLICLIEQFPLATIIHNGTAGLVADHIPLMYVAEPESRGKLVGHVARNNPLWQISEEQELLSIFQGASSYISPAWYETKHEAGKVVPTWNYAVVHAHCSLKAIQDSEQILQIVTNLTDQQEIPQEHPWRVSDAPHDFTDKLLDNIVGIELRIKRWQGKWKVSQNQPKQNQQSVIQGLLFNGTDPQTQMALLVESYGNK